MDNDFNQYVIYDHPKDFPDKFVVRKWIIKKNGILEFDTGVFVADTLEEAREFIPFGFTPMPVFQDDDPAIAEVWM